MIYESISAYWVFDEIKAGNKVFVLDREDKLVFEVNDVTTQSAVEFIRRADEDADKVVFWVEKKEVENG